MELNVNPDSSPVNVPVFNCVVYLTKLERGVAARVANLDGIELTGTDERDALTRTVAAFKALVQKHAENKSEIAWIDPIPDPKPGEQRQFVPVHL